MATVSTIPGNGNVMSILYRASSWSIQLTGDVTADTFVAQLVAGSTITLGTSATYDATYDTTTVVITLSTPQALTLSLGTYTWNITQTTSGNTRTVAQGEWAVVSGNVVFNPPLVGYPAGPFNFNSIYWNSGTNSTGASASQTPGANNIPVLNSSGDLVLPKFSALFDGRIYGTALHNNANPVTGTTNQYIASGTYSPTLTNVTNIASSSVSICNWMRVGNVVTVSGRIDVRITTTLLASQVDISLPIASNLALATQCAGVSNAAGFQASWGILSNTANDRASMFSTGVVSVASSDYYFSFTYLIL